MTKLLMMNARALPCVFVLMETKHIEPSIPRSVVVTGISWGLGGPRHSSYRANGW